MSNRMLWTMLAITCGLALAMVLMLFAAKWLIPVPTHQEYLLEESIQQVSAGDAATIIYEQPVIPDNAVAYRCIARDVANCYQYPDTTSAVIERFHHGDEVLVSGEDGPFYHVVLDDGSNGYVSKRFLNDKNYDYPYVSVPDAEDLRLLIPDAEFDILFASDRNITGHAMYAPIPILESTTANMLLQASIAFKLRGYRLKIYDAYRPKWAQYELFDFVNDVRYIANPYGWGSWHNVGRAVDMSLIDIATGEEVEMPTPMHTFNTMASRQSRERWSEEARKNVDLMTEVMVGAGFKIIETEWWHFEYTGAGNYLPSELQLDSGEYYID